jgi:hypothetical protein
MATHWMTAMIGEYGELVLENLPFQPGQPVEVFVFPDRCAERIATGEPLGDSVVEYGDPFEPVASDDWEALK